MSLNGIWRNGYGSVMSLGQEADGRLFGSYQSTTGSTGTYYVLGACDPREAEPGLGRSLALSIFWRSIGEDPADPSWHWVSGLGGQHLETEAGASLIMMHSMVASTPFPGQAEVGSHLDKLVFTPLPGARVPAVASAKDLMASAPAAGLPSGLEGAWVDEGDPSIRLLPRLLHPRFGFAVAELEIGGRRCLAQGFLDPFAQAEGCRLQALSLTGLIDPEKGETLALSGSLDRDKGLLTLTVFRNAGTSADLTYTQTRVEQLRLVPAQ
jgi:saccharopepsin